MEYSCSCIVKKSSNADLTGREEKNPIQMKADDKVRGCIVLREGEDGLYRWNDMIFSCTEEYGIEEVSI